MWMRNFVAGAVGAVLVLGLAVSKDVRAVAAALVNVTNTAANPVPTRHTDVLNAFGTRVFPSYSSYASIVVPANKYLVITSVTGFNNSGIGSDLEVDATVNGAVTGQRYAFSHPGSGYYYYLVDQHTEIVADPGSTVYFFLSTDSTDHGGYNIDVKGYYVPVS